MNQYIRIGTAVLDFTDTNIGIDFELLKMVMDNQKTISPEVNAQNEWFEKEAPFYCLAAQHMNNMLFHIQHRGKHAKFHADAWTMMTSERLCKEYQSDCFNNLASFIIDHSRIIDRNIERRKK